MTEQAISETLLQMMDTTIERNTTTTRILCGQKVEARLTRNCRVLFTVDGLPYARVGLASFIFANRKEQSNG